MLKKLTGLLILLSFLLVKSTSLFAVLQDAEIVVSMQQQAADETPDTDKESKQLEITDEDFMNQPVVSPAFLTLSKKIRAIDVPNIPAPYMALPYPPPNLAA